MPGLIIRHFFLQNRTMQRNFFFDHDYLELFVFS